MKDAKVKQKFKNILANPFKSKCPPALSVSELQTLQNILESAISDSGLEVKQFAKSRKIQIGLESSLRTINNRQSGCAFVSLNIKPNYIINLISRNAELKDETMPIYGQPNLEEFIKGLFGITAIAMVLPALPNDLKNISEDLLNWVQERRKPMKSLDNKKANNCVKKSNKRKRKISIVATPPLYTKEEEQKDINNIDPSKRFLGDFISFEDAIHHVENKKITLKENQEALNSVLSHMVPKVQSEKPHATYRKSIDTINDDDEEEESKTKGAFQKYQPLIVHKIKPNPNRKRRNPSRKIN